jgi:hypothetical protein
MSLPFLGWVNLRCCFFRQLFETYLPLISTDTLHGKDAPTWVSEGRNWRVLEVPPEFLEQ